MWHLSEIKRRNSAKARPGDKLGHANGNPRACRDMALDNRIAMYGATDGAVSPMASVDAAPMPEYMGKHATTTTKKP